MLTPLLPPQFDNFKRVFKAVEELRGPLAENIQQLFLLPPPLARWVRGILGCLGGSGECWGGPEGAGTTQRG